MSGIRMNTTGISPYILKEMDAGTYELPEKTLAMKYFNGNDSVLELGSAVGYVGICTMRKHPGIQWTGIEANPWCVNRSKTNYEMNNLYPRINFGVAMLDDGNMDEKVKFYVREEFWNSSLDPIELPYSKTVTVVDCPKYDVNELLKGKTALIMDIEGGETNLIKFENGIKLDHIQKIIIEFHARFTGENFVEYAIDSIERTHQLVEKMGEVYYFERKQ